jgi:hemerythrin-like domain-containing protein
MIVIGTHTHKASHTATALEEDIRRRIGDLETAPVDAVALNALGEHLRDHVRYEERMLFGRMEATLGADELDALEIALRAAGETHQPPRA